MRTPSPTKRSRYWPWLLAALILLPLLVYSRVSTFRFVEIDDGVYVAGNPHVLGGLTAENVAWAFTTFHASNWHPLTWISLMLDAQLGGPDARVFHRTNLLLHAANSALLFLVLSRMAASTWRSAFAAALFAVHPLHVESVAWVAERKDVLSTLFWLLTMLAYARYVERPGAMRYALTALMLACGLLAKPMLVTLPLVLLLLDYWPLGRYADVSWSRARRLVLEKLPLLGLAAVSAAITLHAQAAGGAVRSLEKFPLALRFANAAVCYVRYLKKTLWPADLAVLYPYDRNLAWPEVLLASVVLVGLSLLALGLGRRRPYFVVGWLWFVGTLVPVIGLVQVGEEPMADRYTYVPSIGLFLVLAWGLADLVRARMQLADRTRRAAAACAAAGVLLLLGWTARVQASYWEDSEKLFRRALAVHPNNPRALEGLAVDMLGSGPARERDAIELLRTALGGDPRDVSIRTNLGAALLRVGAVDEAVLQYREAHELAPRDPDVLAHLGIALTRQERYDEAEAAFDEALRLDPTYALTHRGLGLLRARRGDHARAADELRDALRASPQDTATRFNLAIALMELRRLKEAEVELREVLRQEPAHAAAHKRLGIVLTWRGALDEAIDEISESLRLDPDQPALRGDLDRLLEVRRRGVKS